MRSKSGQQLVLFERMSLRLLTLQQLKQQTPGWKEKWFLGDK